MTSITFPALPPVSSPESYVSAVNAIPMLTAERELERGVRLASFAIHWIKAEIHEYILRNWRMVKIATTKAQRKLFFNLRSMKSSSAALTRKEIRQMAQTLNVKESDVIEMEQRLQGGDVPLDPTVDDGEEAFTPIAYLAEPSEGPAEAHERNES